jgi:hypothetical protein
MINVAAAAPIAAKTPTLIIDFLSNSLSSQASFGADRFF